MHKTTSLRQKIYNIIREDLEVISKDIYFGWAAINKQIVRDARIDYFYVFLSLSLSLSSFFVAFRIISFFFFWAIWWRKKTQKQNNNENISVCGVGVVVGRRSEGLHWMCHINELFSLSNLCDTMR